MEKDTAYGLLLKGKGLLESGFPEQASIVLEKARQKEPRKGSVLEVLGRAYYTRGRYQQASGCFEDALDVDPTNDYAHFCLGLCYLKLKRKKEAGKHFKIAWFLRPLEMYREKATRFGA